MYYLSRIFSRQNLKILLVVVAVALVVAALWFAGPYVGFGDARPVADISARIVFILSLLFLLLALFARWPWHLMVLIACCAIVWVHGPYLYMGNSYILAGVTSRLLVIGLILGLYSLYFGLLRLRNAAILRRPPDESTLPGGTGSDINAMFQDVILRINQRADKLPLWRRLTGWRIKEEILPWFMILGGHGAGKTSAIIHSGQHFPLSDSRTAIEAREGEPENCRCWLANDAVYIDTSGKYISDPQNSAGEWREILQLLKKHRPSRAVNGALLMIPASEILSQDSAGINELAATFRARLAEMRQIPGIYFPVYVVVTQLDSLSGFAEYFRGLTRKEQQDIWGVSFDAGTGKSPVSQRVDQQLSSLVHCIESDINARLLTEYDLQDRKRMYGFPDDLALMVQQLQQFLQLLFFASRYDDTRDNSALRGVYLTSCYPNTPHEFVNDRTIIQQWSGYISQQSSNQQQSTAEADTSAAESGGSQPCFLRRLFCELIIRDQNLARDTTLNISGPIIQRWLRQIAVLILLGIVSYGLYNSYENNSRYLQSVNTKAMDLREQKEFFVSGNMDARISPFLTSFHTLPEYPALNISDPGLSWRYGLFTGKDIRNYSDSLYQYMLRRLLLPVVEENVTARLNSSIGTAEIDKLYSDLRLYLMVFGITQTEMPFLVSELSGLWQSADLQPGSNNGAEFNQHLKALFSQPADQRGNKAADESLIRQAQDMLARQNRSSRVYQRLKQSLAGEAPADLDLYKLTDNNNGDLFELREGALIKTIPGLFTREGYQLVQKRMLLRIKGLVREDESLMQIMAPADSGDSQGALRMMESVSDLNSLRNDILNHYLDDYTNTWQQFLSGIRIKSSGDVQDINRAGEQQRDLYRLGRLAAPDSPMLVMLNHIVAETTLDSTPSDQSVDKKLLAGQSTLVQQAAQKLTNTERKRLWQHTDSYFAGLRLFVTGRSEGRALAGSGSESGSALNRLREQLSELQVLLSLSKESESDTPQVKSDLVAELRAKSSGWPVPVRSITLPLLDQITNRTRRTEMVRAKDEITTGPAAFCRKTLAGRYPFAKSGREVSIADFDSFFAPGGIAESYFNENLADRVDTTARQWRFNGTDPGDKENQVLKMFRTAKSIRNAFFPIGNGRQLSLSLRVSVPYMSPSIVRLQFRAGNQSLSYSHGPVRQTTINWPAEDAEQTVTLSLTSAITGDVKTLSYTGPWGIFRWLESAQKVTLDESGIMSVKIKTPNNDDITMQVTGMVSNGESRMALLRRFRCP